MFRAEKYFELKARLKIDKLRIDDELIEHPMLLQEVQENAADAIHTRDASKAAYEVACADAAARLRKQTDENGKAYAQNKIDTMIPTQEDVRQAAFDHEDAKRDAAYWTGLVDSMQERGSLMRRFAEMVISGYLTPNAVYQERRQELAEGRKANGWRPR